MIKDEIPRGQLSTIILMTLLERDKYGYEIIDEVLHNTNGKISIKQPSLYSSLKRMEEQLLISSYWRDSEIGGKRHYYHLTDLGKKHLDKWKNDVPAQYLTPSQDVDSQKNENEQETKILKQENIFNLANTTQPQQNTQEISKEELKKNDAFVQFDLFTNSIIVTPPSEDEEPLNQTNAIWGEKNDNNSQISNDEMVTQDKISTQPVQSNQNPILTSYEKPIETKSYTFDYVKKTNKSFSECVNNKSTYEKKYVETNIQEEQSKTFTTDITETTKPGEEMIVEDKNSQASDEEALNNYSSETRFVDLNGENLDNISNYKEQTESNQNNKISISELKNYVQNDNRGKTDTLQQSDDDSQNLNEEIKAQEPIKDDGILITERLNPEDMPKPTKWDKSRFEMYVSANSITPDLKRGNKSDNYEDRVKDLYEQSKASSDNQELELIDSKVKFASYNDLQTFYEEQNIKFKPFKKELKKTDKDYNMIKVNKLNMLTSLSIFAYSIILSIIFGVIYSFVNGVKYNNILTFLVTPIIFAIYFICNVLIYIKTPHKRIALDLTKYKFNVKALIISFLLIPLIFAVSLILGFSFTNFVEYQLIIVYPLCYVFTYIVFYMSQKIILKSKKLY